jgi:hypothetical protein
MPVKYRFLDFFLLLVMTLAAVFLSGYLVPLVFSFVFHLGPLTYKAIVYWQLLCNIVMATYLVNQAHKALKTEIAMDKKAVADLFEKINKEIEKQETKETSDKN